MKKYNFRILTLLLIALVITLLTGCEEENREGQVKTPSVSSELKGNDYLDVIEIFEKNGFSNIKTEKIDDLIFGWLTKEGEVEKVSVDGDENYSSNKWFSKDVEVLIFYHVFPEEDSANKENPNETPKEDKNVEKVKSIFESSLGKEAFDVLTDLEENGFKGIFLHSETKEDMTSTIFSKDDKQNEEFYIPWVIVNNEDLDLNKQEALFYITTDENIDHNNQKESVINKLESKLPASVAWGAADVYGQSQFSKGFKLNMLTGLLAEEAIDENTWFLKSICQVKNDNGNWEKGYNCEFKVTGNEENPKVKDFKIYK